MMSNHCGWEQENSDIEAEYYTQVNKSCRTTKFIHFWINQRWSQPDFLLLI